MVALYAGFQTCQCFAMLSSEVQKTRIGSGPKWVFSQTEMVQQHGETLLLGAPHNQRLNALIGSSAFDYRRIAYDTLHNLGRCTALACTHLFES